MASGNFTNGVWRTIGGRRIFIQAGQSVGDAMKKSGKYKRRTNESAQKKIDEEVSNLSGKDLKNAYNALEKGDKSYEAEAIRSEFNKREKNAQKFHEATQSMIKESTTSNNDSFTMTNGEKEVKVSKDENGKWVDSDGNKYMGYLSKEDVKSYFKGDWKEAKEASNKLNQSNVKSQQSDIEKASGSKVKRSFETDLYGNGKADRFELNDGRYIEHTKEAFGKKEDSWSINKVENGSITSKDFKSYEDMKSYLNNEKGGSKKILTEQKTDSNYSQKQLDNVWKKEDASEVYSHLSRSEQNKMAQAQKDLSFYSKGTPAYENAQDYIKSMDNKAATKFLNNQKQSTSNNGAYRDAFNEYKRLHPNSKITLQRFVQMKRGK